MFLSFSSCVHIMLGKNPTEEELLGLVMEVDIDGNGTIEFGEFIDLMRHNSLDVMDEEADLRMAFKMFDSNGKIFEMLNLDQACPIVFGLNSQFSYILASYYCLTQ